MEQNCMYCENKGLRPEDYRDAIQVQDACNLSGVVYAFSRVMDRICFDHRMTGTADKNTHPIAVLFASKIASLTGCEDSSVFGNAYDRAKEQTPEWIAAYGRKTA